MAVPALRYFRVMSDLSAPHQVAAAIFQVLLCPAKRLAQPIRKLIPQPDDFSPPCR
jgi:uncharacterized protein YggT (Ycf19 family)